MRKRIIGQWLVLAGNLVICVNLILNVPGIFVGIGFGVAFASCGCLFGDTIDKKNNNNR